MPLEYTHVDVFSRSPYSGNGLPVFTDSRGLAPAQMLRITQEMRHFESIFLKPTPASNTVRVRVFDLFEELPFAGHPLIGAAAVLHDRSGLSEPQTWHLELQVLRTVSITTRRTPHGYFGLLDQAQPDFLGVVNRDSYSAEAFSLQPADLHPNLPAEVVSTGLRYLVVPVRAGALERARIPRDITAMVQGAGAQYAVLLDPSAPEIRHWNNDGLLEDVATGSAAGVVGAYMLRHGLAPAGETFQLSQGRFTGRPSALHVLPEGTPGAVERVHVGGDVVIVGHGALLAAPEIAG